MFFRILWNYISGYVNVQIEGFYIERFINICISKNILLWNMYRKKSSILNANMAINDFRKIKQIAKTTSCRVKINKKRGFPFIFNKYKKRKIFMILLVIVCIFIIAISNFIWNIEIKGIDTISKDEIEEQLKANGLKIGSYKNSVDINKIINEIRLNRNDIAWIGIDFVGTNAIIEIVETKKKPDIIDRSDFCNIIADKKGLITKINVQNGTAKVAIGDIVKKGDLLVEGKIQGKYTDPIYVHSLADIEAKVWYSKSEKVMYHQSIEEKTGNEEIKYGIKFNNFQINFNKTLSKFKNYDTISESKKICLFPNFYLPIEITKLRNQEKVNREIVYGKDELQTKTINDLKQELENEISNKNNILNQYINVKEHEEYIDVEVVYEVLEKLGTKDKINF